MFSEDATFGPPSDIPPLVHAGIVKSISCQIDIFKLVRTYVLKRAQDNDLDMSRLARLLTDDCIDGTLCTALKEGTINVELTPLEQFLGFIAIGQLTLLFLKEHFVAAPSQHRSMFLAAVRGLSFVDSEDQRLVSFKNFEESLAPAYKAVQTFGVSFPASEVIDAVRDAIRISGALVYWQGDSAWGDLAVKEGNLLKRSPGTGDTDTFVKLMEVLIQLSSAHGDRVSALSGSKRTQAIQVNVAAAEVPTEKPALICDVSESRKEVELEVYALRSTKPCGDEACRNQLPTVAPFCMRCGHMEVEKIWKCTLCQCVQLKVSPYGSGGQVGAEVECCTNQVRLCPGEYPKDATSITDVDRATALKIITKRNAQFASRRAGGRN
jgi:hypothetical protein